jgi:hypothetical protein
MEFAGCKSICTYVHIEFIFVFNSMTHATDGDKLKSGVGYLAGRPTGLSGWIAELAGRGRGCWAMCACAAGLPVKIPGIPVCRSCPEAMDEDVDVPAGGQRLDAGVWSAGTRSAVAWETAEQRWC